MAQLTPRYGNVPILTLDGPPAAILEPAVCQRQRLVEVVSAFTDDEWQHPSRCDGWSSRDVIAHLDSTNGFWLASVAAGCAGAPTTFLASFDPVATPAQLVASTASMSTEELLRQFATSTTALADRLATLDADDWTVLAEAPPGHLRLTDVIHHALWDSWIHERDILVPLGIEPQRHDDEIAACLRYALALTPAFGLIADPSRSGVISLSVTNPVVEAVAHVDAAITVTTGAGDDARADVVVRGDAVEVLDALSVRRPLATPVPAEAAWLMNGLATVFDAHDE